MSEDSQDTPVEQEDDRPESKNDTAWGNKRGSDDAWGSKQGSDDEWGTKPEGDPHRSKDPWG